MSKIKAGLFGFFIGDAMGVPVEFSMREKLLKSPITDMMGYGSHPVPAGSWSDDSSMTLALIDSINNNKTINYDDIMNNFRSWVNEGKYTPQDNVFDIGRTCLRAISNSTRGIKPIECGLKDINSNGNGSLMRILPIALYAFYNELSEKEILELVNNVSSMTHGHNISKLGCYIYVRYVMLLLDGIDKDTAYEWIKKIDYSYFDSDTIDVYERILIYDIKKLNIDDIKSSGYVVDTLEASLWVFLNSNNYKEAIIGSINLGNDTDTIGAICGSMAGIYYGYNDIPLKWINTLIKKDYLFETVKKFENELYKSKKDSIIGASIGDIVGSRFELNNCKKNTFEFMPKYKCRITDDTVMTIAIAKALMNSKDNYSDLKKQAIDSMVEIGRKYNNCGFGRSFYNWILSEEHTPYNSYGNGAAMRVSACGMIAKNEEEVKSISRNVIEVSHNHPDGILGAEAVSMMIFLIKQGFSKKELKEYFVKNYYNIDFSYQDLLNTYKFDIKCEGTVPQAFECFYESEDFEDAIRKTIYIGGDSDTIGAICGSMAGLYYGIPKKWYDKALSFIPEDLIEIYNDFKQIGGE